MADTTGTEFESVADDLSSEDKAQLDAIRSGKPLADPEPEAGMDEAEDDVEADEPDEVEAKQDEEHPAKEEKKKNGRVPLRKLMAAEEKAKNYEKEAATLREQMARADERMKMLFQAQQQAAQQQQIEQPPDPKTDPIAALEYTQRQLEEQKAYQAQQARQTEEARAVAQVENVYRRSWSDMLSSSPETAEAYQQFTNQLSTYFTMRGATPEQADEMVKQEERVIAYNAMQRGLNPAQVIVENLKATGWQPAPKEQKPVVAAEKRVEMREKGQAAAKSLSNAGGQRGDGVPSAAELANMSDEDFMELRSRMSDRQWQRMLGAA